MYGRGTRPTIRALAASWKPVRDSWERSVRNHCDSMSSMARELAALPGVGTFKTQHLIGNWVFLEMTRPFFGMAPEFLAYVDIRTACVSRAGVERVYPIPGCVHEHQLGSAEACGRILSTGLVDP